MSLKLENIKVNMGGNEVLHGTNENKLKNEVYKFKY